MTLADTHTTRTISRRRFAQSVGAAAGLTIFWSNASAAQEATPANATPISAPEAGATPVATPEPQAQKSPIPMDVDSYLRINEDGTITLLTGKVEFGQGIRTGFAQLAAEELSVPFESVQMVMGRTDEAPYDIGTFGSLSTRVTGPRIRQAGAAMRQWLIDLAAEESGADASTLSLKDGKVVSSDGSTSYSYAELAKGKRSARELDPEVKLKDPKDFTVLGQGIPRPDVALKVNGSAKYGIDAVTDNMVWGKIVRPPAFGSTLTDIDFSEAEKMDGVVGTYRDGDFAGIAAETLQQAEAAVARVKATWKRPADTATSDTIFDYLMETADEGQKLGDDNTSPADSEEIANAIADPLEVTYRAPYVNHAPIEPRSALVSVTDEGVHVWSSTQNPFGVRDALAKLLERDAESVVVEPQFAGGAFGSKIQPMAESEAARLSQALGRPVKLVWTRDEEFSYGQYRPAMLVNIVTGLDGDGNIAAWQYDLYSASYYPVGSDNAIGAAADWGADILEIYDVTARTIWYQSDSPLPPYYWRVNGATTNTWAREVTMDMLAEKAGVDPVTFRKNHLGDNDRMAAVLDAAVEKAGWKPGVGQTGQGIGVALGFDADTFVAEVAKVEMDEQTGEVFARQFHVAVDCGLVVNPEAATHQVEGAVVLGTSSTLREMIKFENGEVTNATFAEYAPITMREAPAIDVTFVEDKTQPMGGIGEPAVAPTAGAIANALYDLAGIRLFDTPFTPDRVLTELKKQG